jgi:tetratricopeptide (TPR) repeat protein
MAIRGSLREASLADVVQLLAAGQKTGRLALSARSALGAIYFDRGRICFASIVNRRDRLGDTLLKSGRLRREQLDAAIVEQSRDPGARLGDILVRQGAVSRDVLHEHIRLQIREAVFTVFTWTQGTFTFEADVRPEHQDFLVSINPDELLLEAATRVDEWSLIEKRIPSFALVFDLDRRRIAESDVNLTPEQSAIIRLVDGRRDVQQIMDEAGLGEFEAGKALYGLASAGFLHRVGTAQRGTRAPAREEADEQRALGIALYQTGLYDDAARALQRAIESHSEDNAAQFYLGLCLLRQLRWEDAAAAFRSLIARRGPSGPVLHNLAYALERLGRYEDARRALEEAQRRGLHDNPIVRTSLGIVLMHLGDLSGADEALANARALFAPHGPNAAWFHAAALVAAVQGDYDRSEQLLAEGVHAYPRAAALLSNQAVVFERRGRVHDALLAADRATQEPDAPPQAFKTLGDLHLRLEHNAEALAAYQHAVSLDTSIGADTFLRIGAIYFRHGDRASAVVAWERALEIDPQHAVARTNLDVARRIG